MVERTMTTEEEHALTWAHFQEILIPKYFPRNVKDDMVEEFSKLEQGEDETVKDYEARFSGLSRFATHVIDTKERRAKRFRNGLRIPRISSNPVKLVGRTIEVYVIGRMARVNVMPRYDMAIATEDAEAWLSKLKKRFKLLNITDRQKVDLSIYHLENEADQWWKMVELTLTTEEEHALTWARFQEIALAKYFATNEKDDMVEEFSKLEQGEDETVKDYEARFARLSKFATHVIDTEERRATRFRNGLRYNIQKILSAVTLDTYGQVLDKEDAEAWLSKLKKRFKLLNITDRQKVDIGIYQLENEAHQWWKMVERTMTTEEEHALTWARFQEIFIPKYFPRNVKDDMVEEFSKLEQGEDETVKDYEARFAGLSRFATHVIDTEERRAKRFRNGLRYNIRKFLTAVTLDTYGEVLDKA
ncbi:hypothetical protein RJ640_001446 [Escallonia rubra]|uniref:Retrotransposon gag domain-containing protein n=1 Tax=Escallonia rubra TaxID=112253 RepID=A0AA88UK90_9ASTE|nr:hypothetical protein RJ640_001446 [Escallonia rubra]